MRPKVRPKNNNHHGPSLPKTSASPKIVLGGEPIPPKCNGGELKNRGQH